MLQPASIIGKNDKLIQDLKSDLDIATMNYRGKTMQMTRQYFDIYKLADIEAMIKSRIKNCSKTGHEASEEGAGEDQKPKGKR